MQPNDIQNNPALFFLLFIPLLSIGMMYIVARMGWKKLADRYMATDAPHGKKMHLFTIRIGLTRYNNAISLWITERGFYLKSMFFFRMFHPTLFIPWHAITKIEESGIFGMKYYKIHIGLPAATTITANNRVFEALRRTGQVPEQALKGMGRLIKMRY